MAWRYLGAGRNEFNDKFKKAIKKNKKEKSHADFSFLVKDDLSPSQVNRLQFAVRI